MFFITPAQDKCVVAQTVYQGDCIEVDLHPQEDDCLLVDEVHTVAFPHPISATSTVTSSTPIPSLPTLVEGGKKRKLNQVALFSEEEEEDVFSTPLSTTSKVTDTSIGECSGTVTSGYSSGDSFNRTYTVSKSDKVIMISSYGCKPYQVETFLLVCNKIEQRHPGGLSSWFRTWCNQDNVSICNLEGDKNSGVYIHPSDSGVIVDLKDLVARLT